MSEELLDRLVGFACRYVAMRVEQARAVGLWIAHAHAVEAVGLTPYLAVTSAEKQSGKTSLLGVLELLVPRPWRAISPSEAVLYRKIERDQPTLLLDEVDAIFGAKANGNTEGLRALLNAGNQRGTRVPRCSGPSMQLVDFSVFCPKALAGIGELPETVADRAIPIRLKRAAPGETVTRFTERERRRIEPEAQELRQRLEAWAEANLPVLADAEPELPEQLSARAADAWEPLLAIADLAGGHWPTWARQAALALSAGQEPEQDSLGVRLLADIRTIFQATGERQLASAQLIEQLAAIEEAPWADYRAAGPIKPAKLANLLRRYEIKPRDIRLDDRSLKGYRADEFTDTWARYLPPADTPASTLQPGLRPRSRDSRDNPLPEPTSAAFQAATTIAVSRNGNRSFPLNHADVAAVAAPTPIPRQTGCRYPSHRHSDWINANGRPVCGICHPPLTGLHT